MNRYLRYGLVAAGGLLAVILTLLLVQNRKTEDGMSQTTSLEESTEVETTQEAASPEESTETASPDLYAIFESKKEARAALRTLESLEETEEEGLETETEEASVPQVGLRSYFSEKLAINPDKVKAYLNIRDLPDMDSEILWVIWPNDLELILGKEGDWYKIWMDGTVDDYGYVHQDYVLTGDDLYEAWKDYISYSAMAKVTGVLLYTEPDLESDHVETASKAEVFRVYGIEDGFYKVGSKIDDYQYLYIPQEDVVLNYRFMGVGNDNGLSDEDEELLASLDLSGHDEICQELTLDAELEEAAYEAYLKESAAQESAAEEEARQAALAAAEEARKQAEAAAAAEKASYQAQAAAMAAVVAAAQAKANETGEAQLLEYSFRVTHYCSCTICNGAWGNDDPTVTIHGSSGMDLVPYYTVAADKNVLPYGTKFMMNGKEYIVADTGVQLAQIDVFVESHQACLDAGLYYAQIYILPQT